MNKESADLVYPIFRQGLRLKERLRRGERLNMRNEQGELRKLFRTTGAFDSAAGNGPGTFLGVRYPLACWLDEVFILDDDSPWKEEWRDEPVEFTLFRSRLRSQLFWEQARLAETEGNADALEVFYLCVMLGFRGELRDDPGRLLDWRDNVEVVIGRGRAADWPGKPADLPLPEANVPPLKAKEQLRWLMLSFALAIGLLILIGAFLGTWKAGG
jgi:type VI secretion system protein ImpK